MKQLILAIALAIGLASPAFADTTPQPGITLNTSATIGKDNGQNANEYQYSLDAATGGIYMTGKLGVYGSVGQDLTYVNGYNNIPGTSAHTTVFLYQGGLTYNVAPAVKLNVGYGTFKPNFGPVVNTGLPGTGVTFGLSAKLL